MALDDAGGLDFGFAGQVRFSANDRAAVLPAPYTFTTQDHGVHAFSITLGSAGSRLLTAYAPQLSPGTIGVQVGGPAASFKLTGLVSPVAAGTPEAFTVTAYDANGRVAAGYGGTVSFASDDGQAGLPAAYTFTAADAGRHTFSATPGTVGRHTISVTDAADPGLQGTGRPIQVTPGPLAALYIAAPLAAIWGVPFEVRVTATDANGNTVPTYGGTVSFSSTDPLAILPADYTFTAHDRGTHVFTVTYNSQVYPTLTASDGTFSASADTTMTGPAARFRIDAVGLVIAGQPLAITVQALDALGNTVSGYTGTVAFSSSDGAAVLPADYTFTTADQGVHTFEATLNTPGNQALWVSEVNDPNIIGAATIEVTPAASLAVAGFPSPVAAGTPGTFTVTAYAFDGSVATGYTGTVSFASSDDAAVLPADYTFTAADAGVHTFQATLNTPGTQALSVDDVDFADALSGEQDGIEVTAPGGAPAVRHVVADAAFALLAPGGSVGLGGAVLQSPSAVTRSAGEPSDAVRPEAGADRWADWALVRPSRPARPDTLAAAFDVMPGDDWLAW